MNMHRFFAILLITFLVGACSGGDETATPAPPAMTERAAAPAAEPAASPATTEPDPASAAAAPAVVEEAAPAAVAETPPPRVAKAGDTSWKYSAGKHYSQLTTAEGTTGGPGAIEVTEVFWYGCPHCFSFDPIITRWQDKLPGDVRFVRMPVMWNPTNEIHARMYYTAEALGKLDEMHAAFFNALHRDGKTLTREDDIRDFFAENGVSNEVFDETFRSFAVESKLNRAKSLTQRYRIRSVPVIVVDGKYVVDGPEIKSFGDMLSVTDELIAKERVDREGGS